MNLATLTEAYSLSADGPTKQVLFRSQEMVLILFGFLPGQALPPHKHPDFYLQVFVLQGSGLFRVDEEELPATAPQVLTCEGNVSFGVLNNSQEPLYLLVMLRRSPMPDG